MLHEAGVSVAHDVEMETLQQQGAADAELES